MTATRTGLRQVAHRHEDSPADRPLLGWLDNGTAFFSPPGELLVEGDRVCCHLCGRWFLSVASHLRAHGWNKSDYLEEFGLELTNPLAGEATHKRRAAAMTMRQATEPALLQAQQQAKLRARNGVLAASAAQAARGRRHSAERLPKTRAALAAISTDNQARANVQRGEQHCRQRAVTIATGFGFDDFESYLNDRLGAGLSLAAISGEAGQHKDWLARHLAVLVPGLAAGPAADPRWTPVVARLGFTDLDSYLRTRHLDEHRTVAAIALETGLGRAAVASALLRCGIEWRPHAGKRYDAEHRDRLVARALGFDSLADYAGERRAAGASWRSMATEAGLPESTLRRRTR